MAVLGRCLAVLTLVFAAFVATTLAIGPAQAQSDDDIDALFEALAIPEILAIMQIESASYGADIATDMLPHGGPADWPAIVAGIYDVDLPPIA